MSRPNPKPTVPPPPSDDHPEDSDGDDYDDDEKVDLDDPENRVIDDDDRAAPEDDDDEDDDDDDYGYGGRGRGKYAARRPRKAQQGDDDDDNHGQQQQEEEEEEEQEEGDIPDKEPLRDDSCGIARRPQPLHALDAHPTVLGLVACGGEEDTVFIYYWQQLEEGMVAPVEPVPASSKPQEDGAAAASSSLMTPKDDPTIPSKVKDSSFRLVASLTGHTDTVTCVKWSPAGDMVASGAMDCHVRLWGLNGGAAITSSAVVGSTPQQWVLLFDLSDLAGEIETLLWHKSGLMLLAGASDAQIMMWNTKKGTVANFFSGGGHAEGIRCIIWGPLGEQKKIISGASDGSVVVWNPKTAEVEGCIMKDLSPDQAGISTLTCLSGDLLLIGCDDGTMHILSLSKMKIIRHLTDIHDQAIEGIILHPNPMKTNGDQLFVSYSCDGRLVVWNAASLALPRAVFHSALEGFTHASWWCIPGMVDAIVATGTDGDVTVWDGLGESGESPLKRLMGHRRAIMEFALVPFPPAAAGSKTLRGNAAFPIVFTASDDGTLRSFLQ